MAENIEIDRKDNTVVVAVDAKIFPLDTILSAAYVFIDDAYVVITGDPREQVVVKLKGKDKCNLAELGRNFNNELVNYAFYSLQTARSMPIRTAIVQRAFFTHAAKPLSSNVMQKREPSYLDDPYGIRKPYRGKHGRGKKGRK